MSFTFDDFPASAVEKGAAILEHYGARGTYYWSGAFMDHDDPSVDPVTWAHVQAVVARGHELACHSFSHLDCARESSATLERDLSRNKAAVLRAFRTNSPVLEHFAYPYGNVSPAARRVVARRFRTGRGIYRGINLGWADAALLSANPIYGPDASYRNAMALIGTVIRQGGWLIFFTHDVSDQPTEYGAHAVVLEQLVRAARDGDCLLLPVGEVADALGLP